jgi:hypothetical protein
MPEKDNFTCKRLCFFMGVTNVNYYFTLDYDSKLF